MQSTSTAAMAQGLVALSHPQIDIQLAYATENNFVGRKLYEGLECFLRPEAASALLRAADQLTNSEIRLVVLDAYRPVSVQRLLWAARPDPEFVADPAIGSDHSRGVAVDVTLANAQGHLDMGTAFDAALPLSHHDHPDLSAPACGNRAILRKIMAAGGFVENPYEWWHYSLPGAKLFPILHEPE